MRWVQSVLCRRVGIVVVQIVCRKISHTYINFYYQTANNLGEQKPPENIMNTFLTKSINIPLGKTENHIDYVAACCRLTPDAIHNLRLYKQSVDARDKDNIHFVCSFLFDSNKAMIRNAQIYVAPHDILAELPVKHPVLHKTIVVVGAGPAGLFAALYLAKVGFKVIVIEKGLDIAHRTKIVKKYFARGEFNPSCNVQFGLGGAGAFSDGKLTTGISTPYNYTVFRQFVRAGAPEDIMYSALPHVGTDKLGVCVGSLRDEIMHHGGEFWYNSYLDWLFLDSDNNVRAVKVIGGEKKYNQIECDAVVLATGHSARDVFELLDFQGANLAFKPFAVGLRIEHTRQFIDNAQYGLAATHRDLSAASYKLVHNGEKHGVYSFCMCPGGIVVAANSEPDTVVVNGMSNYARNAANSNSAIVVTVNADDVARFGYGNSVFAGVDFQRDLERRAFALGGGNYVAPCQSVSDFVANRTSTADSLQPFPSYPRGVKPSNLRNLLPNELNDSIVEALAVFDRKIKGFGTSGVLTGVETRTSSPIRILRDESYQSNLRNLYPTGEGAGYAGGIVSSAVDGLRVATAIFERFR